jgi:hypothetical protein
MLANRCVYVHDPVGGRGDAGKYPRSRQVCHALNNTTNHPHAIQHPSKYPNLEYLVLSGQMVMCVHNPVNGRGASQIPPTTKCQVRSKYCTRPPPTSSIYCHAYNLWPFHVSPHRKNGVHTCNGLVGGWGDQIPPSTPSTVTPQYDTSLPCVPFNKILTKQTCRTC